MKTLLILLLSWVGPTKGAEVAKEPVLRIEAEAHSVTIKHVDVARAGGIALTASQDKTARLWELPSGRLLRVLRPPIGRDAEGMLYCCALSPDGTIAIVGGYTGYEWNEEYHLYVFDVASGKLIRQLGKLPTIPLSVAFSANGKFLACVTAGLGLFVWDAGTGREIGQDREYGNQQSPSVAWDSGNRIVTTCEDDFVRLYDVDKGRLRLLVRHAPKLGTFPCSARFSPDGTQIAVGFYRSRTIAVLDSKDLSIITGVEAGGSQNFVSWNHDGTALAAGGAWGPPPEIPDDLAKKKSSIPLMLANVERLPNPKYALRQWKWPQRTPYVDTTIGSGELHDIQALPDGSLLFAGDSWGLVSPTGRLSQPVTSPRADFRAFVGSRFYVSSNGSTVAFCFRPFGEPPVRFSLASRTFTPFENNQTTDMLHLAKTKGLKVANWQPSLTSSPTLDGRPIVFHGERSSSLAIAADNSFFILGAYLSLSCYSRRGDMLWDLPTAGPAFNVNLTSKDKVVVASLGDGTIRWYRALDGQELLALFPHSDRRRWVLWTPQGYYDCSPGGEDLIGWHINTGLTEGSDFFSASRFRKIFYRPDVIDQVLKEESLDSVKALSNADRILNEKDKTFQPTDPAELPKLIKSISPPVVQLETGGVLRKVELARGQTKLKLRFAVRQTGDRPPVRITVRFNGRLLIEKPWPQESESEELDLDLPGGSPGELSVFATVEDENGRALTISEPAILRVERKTDGVLARQPRLFVISVGVSRLAPDAGFPDIQDLPQSANDAVRIAEALNQQRGRIFAIEKGTLELPPLKDSEATFAAIQAQLQEVAREATFGDVFVFFFSGHGMVDPATGYYAVTYDTKHNRPLLSGDKLSQLIDSIKARTIVILETCQSGGLFRGPNPQDTVNSPKDLGRLINQLSSAEEGVVVITSAGKQASLQDPEKGGPLARALLEVLTSKKPRKADGLNADNLVTCATLRDWVPKRVPEIVEEMWKTSDPKLTAGRIDSIVERNQHPTFVMPKGVPDFPVAQP